MGSSKVPSFQLPLDMMRLGLESQAVIGLRLFQMATGGVPFAQEMSRMIPEKMAALADAQTVAAMSIATGQPHLASQKVVRLYRSRVRKNQKRLDTAKGRL